MNNEKDHSRFAHRYVSTTSYVQMFLPKLLKRTGFKYRFVKKWKLQQRLKADPDSGSDKLMTGWALCSATYIDSNNFLSGKSLRNSTRKLRY